MSMAAEVCERFKAVGVAVPPPHFVKFDIRMGSAPDPLCSLGLTQVP